MSTSQCMYFKVRNNEIMWDELYTDSLHIRWREICLETQRHKKKTEVCSGNQAKGHTEQYANTTWNLCKSTQTNSLVGKCTWTREDLSKIALISLSVQLSAWLQKRWPCMKSTSVEVKLNGAHKAFKGIHLNVLYFHRSNGGRNIF